VRYFAYGSNMLERRLRDAARAPSASFVGVGSVRRYRLVFHKAGMDGSGKCTLDATDRDSDAVYGVLFEIDDAQSAPLDAAEGVQGGGYSRTEIPVEQVGCGTRVPAQTYIANRESVDESCVPFEWYKALVVAGALEHGLPDDYVRALQGIVAVRDPDSERREAALAVLGDFRREFDAGRLTRVRRG
jgi:gamma-glutamylcyclotransferase (GGCT)/AIG2-like uncharacterized protein YtfP